MAKKGSGRKRRANKIRRKRAGAVAGRAGARHEKPSKVPAAPADLGSAQPHRPALLSRPRATLGWLWNLFLGLAAVSSVYGLLAVFDYVPMRLVIESKPAPPNTDPFVIPFVVSNPSRLLAGGDTRVRCAFKDVTLGSDVYIGKSQMVAGRFHIGRADSKPFRCHMVDGINPQRPSARLVRTRISVIADSSLPYPWTQSVADFVWDGETEQWLAD